MTRKIARQSEVTPSKTVDEYLWNERLGVTSVPPVSMPQQGQSPTSSLPPQTSQAPTIDYDSANSQSDMFGSGVSSEGQAISPPKAPNTTPASVPARSKAASIGAFDLADHLMTEHGMLNELIRDHDENVKLHDQEHRDWPNSAGHKHSSKVTAVSTLYGDVEPTPTTGESPNDGSQANRNNSPENLPNGPDSSPANKLAPEEEGAAAGGLASEVGEAATLAAFASKHWIKSVLDPKESSADTPSSCPGCGEKTSKTWVNESCKTCGYNHNKEESKSKDSQRVSKKEDDEEGHYKYIKHRNGKWVIIQKGTGKVLSTHDTREKAISSFKAMMMSKHGG